jgi:protein transport protein SEC61 subunit gamma-like protein
MDVAGLVKEKLKEWKRVLKITSKPDREEFEMSAKVTGAGIIVIGIVGFLIYAAFRFLPFMQVG